MGIHEHIRTLNIHLWGSRTSDSMAAHASQECAVFLADGVHQPRSSSFFVAGCEYRKSKPLESRVYTERITEFVLIISLMGAGLKLDRPVGWQRWAVTWRLLGISMPLTIAAIAALGWGLLGLGLASAILLGAALAPTDPVLASDIQVGPPNTEEEDEVRFALTSEAGLNDGLSFPFVNLAIAIAVYQGTAESWFQNWFLISVVWKLGAALVIG